MQADYAGVCGDYREPQDLQHNNNKKTETGVMSHAKLARSQCISVSVGRV